MSTEDVTREKCSTPDLAKDDKSEQHLVNFTVSVEHVFNIDEDQKLPAEAMKSWQYYHVEYNLLPGKGNSKADVVMSGLVAKMYSDYDTRLLKTRTDGDKMFVMWSHKHPISVNKKLLLDLFSHTVNVRFWDTKDKVSVRAKFDRPKVFRLPPPPGPKPVDARFDGGGTAQSNARRHLYIEKSTSPSKLKPSQSDIRTDRTSGTDLAGTTPTELRRRKMEKDLVSENGKCVLSVSLASLFAGNTVLFVRSEPFQHFTALKQVVVKISLNKDLMSEKLSRELAPMKLNIVRSKNNPDTPMPYKQLSEHCKPVFARYQFCGQDSIDTEGLPHTRHVEWNHTHVILLGVLSRPKLEEFLTGPPFEVELHDRDRRTDIVKPLPKIFSVTGNEEALFDTSGKSKALGPPGVPWDPYGVAKFDLAPILLGEQKLRLKSPVLPCVRPQTSTRTYILKNEAGIDQAGTVPCGRYLESGTIITVELSLAHRLVDTTNYLQLYRAPSVDIGEADCPFVRIVYILVSSKSDILSDLMAEVLSTNVAVFHLDTLPESMYASALSTYKLTKLQERSKDLDYITGFHVLDSTSHIIVLEGVSGGAVTRLWEKMPKTHKHFQVLYNSQLCFSSRLYSSLQPDIVKVKLFEPLTDLVKHPSLYVRGSVSREAYDGLICLCELRTANLLLTCSRNDSFPTADMVKLLAMEFGVPHSLDEVKPKNATKDTAVQPLPKACDTATSHKRKGRWSPVDNYNTSYDERDLRQSADFVKQNMEKVKSTSDENGRKAPKTIKVSCDEDVGHNYSTSTRNATELAKKEIRDILKQTPNERYTYSQEYACQTVSPRCVGEVRLAEMKEKKEKWRTSQGFLFPSHRTALESNKHGNLPHYSREEQLREPWEENILHAAKLKPTVDWKTFSWNDRGDDFSIPMRLPPPPHPLTIHLQGERRGRELLEYTSKEEAVWRRKLVVSNVKFGVHRTAASMELRDKGAGAASQQDKAGSILKDPPQKLSLSAPKLRLDPIPPVDVVTFPRDGEEKVFQPGPYTELSWSRDKNYIAIKRGDKQDNFALHFTPHSPLAKLSIKPLLESEKLGHLWETHTN